MNPEGDSRYGYKDMVFTSSTQFSSPNQKDLQPNIAGEIK